MIKNRKVIFFDMGNTLLHFHHGKSDKEKDDKGIKYLTDFFKTFNNNIGMDSVRKDFFNKWQEVMALRKLTCLEYPVEEYLNEFLKGYDVKLDLDMCIKAMDIFYTEYRKYVLVEKEIHKTLDKLIQKGYRIGVISNTSLYDEVMINCFKEVGLYKYIDTFTFSYYLKVGKPKKEIFKVALDRMNIEGKDAIMVGDNLLSDIKPAQSLGVYGIWFNKYNRLNDTEIKPNCEISQLTDLGDIL
ncbi:HAD family hydrolase [Dethiothermospora halolimnae]|uniref:HAD family hydrolase n=1 Tax=Dethiothermospora halolimnae TaxID=3114390 RepID=UPI003CCBBFAD